MSAAGALTQVIAHRGASRDAPENTLAAFELAVSQRADMIETDLHLTADGEIAIYHDAEVGGAPIARLSLAQLRERLPGMPTLPELLSAFGTRIPWNLELKTGVGGDYPGLEERTLAEVRARGLLPQTVFSSFREPVLARVRAAEPQARLGLLLDRILLGAGARARRLAAEALHAPLRSASSARVRRWRAEGFAVRVYTVDDPRDQARLVADGADGIFTNVPAQLRALLERAPDSG